MIKPVLMSLAKVHYKPFWPTWFPCPPSQKRSIRSISFCGIIFWQMMRTTAGMTICISCLEQIPVLLYPLCPWMTGVESQFSHWICWKANRSSHLYQHISPIWIELGWQKKVLKAVFSPIYATPLILMDLFSAQTERLKSVPLSRITPKTW